MTHGAKKLSSSDLCAACGICCGDAMFAQIPLQPGDREALERTAYPREMIGRDSIPLPCPMLAGTRCSIYADRPRNCRSYRCDVLRAAEDGAMTAEVAFGHVQEAKALLARLREAMPEGVSMRTAIARWNFEETAGQRLDPAEAAAQLAFFAFNRYLDRHFRPPGSWHVTPNPGSRPSTG